MKEALHEPPADDLLRLARLERGRRVRQLDQHAGRRDQDGEVRDRPARQGAHRRRARGGARVGRDRAARGRRAHPAGYYKDPEKSAATFRELGGQRYSIPGDYATVEADGTITLLGRGSVCINSGGEKIYPEEVEEAVKQHPAVADSSWSACPTSASARRSPRWCRCGRARRRRAGDILGAVEASGLARFKRPRHVVVVDDVPRAPNGKADYKWAKDRRRRQRGSAR